MTNAPHTLPTGAPPRRRTVWPAFAKPRLRPQDMRWEGFRVVRTKLAETPLWLTLLLHAVLVVFGGAAGVVWAFFECIGDHSSGTTNPLEIVVGGFVVGAVWVLLATVYVRWQFRAFERKYGKRQPSPEIENEELERRVRDRIRENERQKEREDE